jgi:chorismate synthase
VIRIGNVWGRNIQFTIFGESHGAAVGFALSGLPAGFAVDWDGVRAQMARRAPSGEAHSTARREPDELEVLSGYFGGHTTGSPLAAIIRNADARSGDYEPRFLRPGHADLPLYYKFGGFADYRGGGHSSGRLTAPLVAAGAIAGQYLAGMGITVAARAVSIGGYSDASGMADVIAQARADGDSVGGVIECRAGGVPPGLGDPFFDSIESAVAGMMFSIPAVKAVEFGEGFRFAGMRGSEANDPIGVSGGIIAPETNRSGGANGGITNGAELVFRVAIRPTPTIAAPQRTADTKRAESVLHSFGGRHDVCVAPRAVPAVEGGAALVLLDAALAHQSIYGKGIAP